MLSITRLSRRQVGRLTRVSFSKFAPQSLQGSCRWLSTPVDVVVIGGGPGGYVCAIKARQLGLNVTCVEERGSLGGTCLNVGCIPSKTLLDVSHKYHEVKTGLADRGIETEAARVNLEKVMKSKDEVVTGLTGGIEYLFKKNKVEYAKGRGRLKSPNCVSVELSNGSEETIETKHIVIATGSESASLPGIEIDEDTIVSSTGALAFESIPRKLIVIGAGVIGLELGSVWQRFGAEVIVVEYMDKCLPGMDEEISRKFERIIRKQGVDMRLSCGVVGAEKVEGGVEVTLESKQDGSHSTIVGDRVLVATGRLPFVSGLGLDRVDVHMDGRFIAVNDRFETTPHRNIFAIGDVVRGPMLAHKAEEEGIAVAEIIATGHGHVNYDCIPNVVYTFPEIASVGQSEEDLKDSGRGFTKGIFNFSANSRARCTGEIEGFVKVLADSASNAILGCHIIGPNAGEMISEVCVGMEYGASAEDLARTCHPHPTLSEALKEACMATYSSPIHQ